MTSTLLTSLGAMALATSLGGQPQTPATQPVRPPRPPVGEPAPAPPTPDPARPRTGSGDGERTAEPGDPEPGTLTLKGCLQRPSARTFRLAPVEADDATVTAEIRLGGDAESLLTHVGQVVEVRGRYEQDTPASRPARFSVERVRALSRICPAK